MTLQKTMNDLNRFNELVVFSPAIVSVKRLKADVPEYVQIGPVINGVFIEHVFETAYFSDDGITGFVGSVNYSENVILRFALSQAGLFNLALAINCNDDDNIEITQPVYDPPSDGVVELQTGGRKDLEEYEIVIQSRIASGMKIREYTFFRAVPDIDFVHAYHDDSQTLYSCRFRLLMDTSKETGKMLYSVSDYYDNEHDLIYKPNY